MAFNLPFGPPKMAIFGASSSGLMPSSNLKKVDIAVVGEKHPTD
jgi:hypothetical protein